MGFSDSLSDFSTLTRREIVDPFRKIQIDERAFNPAFLNDVAPQAAVVVGLALRRPGDR